LIVITTTLYLPHPSPKSHKVSIPMMPNSITLLFKEAHDSFPPIEGKPTNDNLLVIQETLPRLMVIPCNLLNGVHSLTAIFMEAARYKEKNCIELQQTILN
jgi:hypothetical protein